MDKLFNRLALLLLIFISNASFCGPWLSSGEPWSSSANTMASKSDIDLLAAKGFIQAPVLTWPIAWENIGPSLLSESSKNKIKKSPTYIQLVYFRVLAQYENAIKTSVKTSVFASGGGNINPFRTFEFQPRSDFNGGVAGEKQGEHWAAKLAVSYGDYADVTGNNVHLDDSYLYGFLGNWGLGVDKMPRWWSPAYSDSLIMSANAPPLPTLTFQRMKAEAFQSKWLSWIGPWTFTTSLSVGGEDVPVQHPLIWLVNLTFRPMESLQISASRNSFFAGDTRPLNWRMLENLLTLNDNCTPANYTNPNYCQLYTPGTEHVEFSIAWTPKTTFLNPTTFYLHTIFNDGHYFSAINTRVPWRTSFLAGLNSVFSLFSGYFRPYLEYEYLVQNGWWLWNLPNRYPDSHIIHDIYGYSQYPYTYYDKIIGSPLGGESQAINVGGIFSEANGNSDTFQIRYLHLNPFGFSSPGYPFLSQDVLWLSMGRTFALPHNLGQLGGQLAYLQSLSPNSQGLKSSPSGFLTWSKEF